MKAHLLIMGLAIALCVAPAVIAQDAELPIPVREGGLLEVETLDYQAITVRRPDPILAPRADGGATALFFYPRKNPTEVVFVNLNTGESHKQDIGNLGNPWSRLWGPDGKLYMGLWGPSTIYRYDPQTDSIETFGVIEPEGSSMPLLTVGTDNKVYGMASNLGHVVSIDPDTDEITRYGIQGPRRIGANYRGSIGVDDDYIYSTLGNVEAQRYTVAMNKETREWRHLEDIRGAAIHQGDRGVTATHEGKTFWLYEGRAIPRENVDDEPPWADKDVPDRIPPPEFAAQPRIMPDSNIVDLDGAVTIYYRFDGEDEWREARYQVDPDPVDLSRIVTLPDGRLFMSTIGYEGYYLYDPDEDNFEHLGIAPTSHYSTVVHDGRVYLASYPGGSGLYVWEPDREWTIGNASPERPQAVDVNSEESNPRRLAMWQAPGGFQHPRFMILAADGALYAGIHGERHNVGGALSWYELETDERGHLREPFELFDVAGMCLALDGTKIAFSTFSVSGLAGEPRPESARLFLFDVESRELDWFIEPFEGLGNTGMVCEGMPGELILTVNQRVGEAAGQAGSTLYTVDMETREIDRVVELHGRLAGPRDYYWRLDFEKGPDGMIYTLYDDYLVRINAETLDITALARVGNVAHVAFSRGDAYLTGVGNLRVIRNILEEQ